MPNLTINGQSYFADAPPDTPLLWVIREDLRLTGTKYGCGVGLCGSCTVHVDGQAVRSCSISVGAVEGKLITTIEGLDSGNAHGIPCNRPGSSIRCRNAAIANPARSCRPRPCSQRIPIRPSSRLWMA